MAEVGNNCVIYFCVKYGYMKSDDEVKKSLKYRQAEELLKHFDCELKYDIITSNNPSRPVLQEILYNKPDVIVMTDINALGSNAEDIKTFYKMILDNGIHMCFTRVENKYLLTLPFSTVEVSGSYKVYCFDELAINRDEILKELSELTPQKIRSKSMSVPRFRIGTEFMGQYWSVETNKQSELQAVKSLQISKNTFRKSVEAYEASSRYEEDLKLWLQVSDIMNIPKRIGAVPSYIEDTYEKYRELAPAEAKAAIFAEYGIEDNLVNNVMYERYLLKYKRKLYNKQYRK